MRAKIAKLICVGGLLLPYHDDIADTVRNMLEDFAAWAFTNPLGITITGTVLAAAIVAIAARASHVSVFHRDFFDDNRIAPPPFPTLAATVPHTEICGYGGAWRVGALTGG